MYFLIAIALFIVIFFKLIPSMFILELFAVLMMLMLVFALMMFFIPKFVVGRRTPQGKETYYKWKNFERYIKEYSLISQRPPASVQIWGRYMVYATALGCADKATKNMRKYMETNQIQYDSFNDNVVSFTYYGGLAIMKSSFNTLSRTDTSTSGIGGAGSGGFGGGGGGTF